MRFFYLLRVATIAAAAVLSVTVVLAQTVTGSVTGTVFDSSNAVIPNATVVAVNTATGVRTTATSNSAGVYSIRFLPVGQYQVEVTAPGFTKLTVPAFALEINQTAKVDAHVTIDASVRVEVQGGLAPILDSSDATLSLSLSANEISKIPLNGRNFSSVTLFQPGAVATDPTGLTTNNAIERNTFNSGVVTINGNRAQANNYTIDGIDINETQNNLIGYNVAPDAIQEVKVISANAPATYGNVNGGDVVTVLKSGTNQFHGSLYEYLENQNLSANTFANKFSGNPITRFTQSIFGGTIGGPIVKNKLFFFADYEGVRNHHGGLGTASVLSVRQRQGDFSELLTQSTPVQLYDPLNNFAPYINNQGVPINNPVVRYLLAHPQYYPLPNRTPTDGLIQNNYQGSTNGYIDNDQGDIKIEWDPRQTDKITGFYSQGISRDATNAVLAITFPNQDVYPDHIGGATWVHTFSPSTVNEARVGFTRIRWDSNIPFDSTGNFANGNSVVGIPSAAPPQFSGFAFQGVGNSTLTGVGVPGQAQVLRDNTFSYGDNLTIQHGKHLLSLGAQLQRYQQNFALYGNGGQLGTFNFSGQFSALPGGNGYGPADWLLDRASQQTISLSNGFFGQRQYRVAGFIQDDWKVTDRLTLNLGLRYEYDSPYSEVNNQTANVFLTGPRAGTVEYAKRVPAGAPAGSIVCDNPGCYEPTYNEFQPRFGFAYQVTPRFVLRGGYGTTSFLEGNSTGERLVNNPPFSNFSQLTALVPSGNSGGSPFAVENGFAVGSGTSISGYTAYPQHIQPAYLQEFSLTVEYQLNNSTSVQAGYIGEVGHHLVDYLNSNQLTPAQAAVGAPGPFDFLVGARQRLFTIESEAYSSYNAGQVTLRHRVSKGFQATVNYTYAHSLTDSQGNFGGANTAQPTATQDGFNLAGDYGPSDQDIRHNLSANGSYALPFGRGEIYGGHVSRALDLLFGGWRIDGTAIAYSGLPVTIFGPDNSGTNSYGGARANQYRPLRIRNRSVAHWFGTDLSATPCNGPDNGTCAFGPTAPFTFGTSRVGSTRAPGFEQIDTTASKDFHITERQSVGFNTEAYNVFNFASYGNPDSNVGDTNFGQITSTRSGPRTIQLAVHYTF
jgi:outer membrane receptor protein involved in Fe transport